jgi:hypothetical protein
MPAVAAKHVAVKVVSTKIAYYDRAHSAIAGRSRVFYVGVRAAEVERGSGRRREDAARRWQCWAVVAEALIAAVRTRAFTSDTNVACRALRPAVSQS